MKQGLGAIAAVLALSACDRPANQSALSNAEQPVIAVANDASSVIPPPGTGPDARTPFGESKSAIDPKGPEAAHALVQKFADRLQARRFGAAYALISRVLPTWKESEFAGDYSARREIRAVVGKPAAPEGAAGSVYVTVPLFVAGRFGDGRPFRESWTLTLRRVNDVPGSTAEQRNWHIEQIDIRRAS
jgi:hypothetical protein